MTTSSSSRRCFFPSCCLTRRRTPPPPSSATVASATIVRANAAPSDSLRGSLFTSPSFSRTVCGIRFSISTLSCIVGLDPLPLGANVQRIAQTVAEQVECERRDDQERAREEHQPPGDVVELRSLREDLSPRRLVRRNTKTKVGECRLEQDVRRYQQRRVDDQR